MPIIADTSFNPLPFPDLNPDPCQSFHLPTQLGCWDNSTYLLGIILRKKQAEWKQHSADVMAYPVYPTRVQFIPFNHQSSLLHPDPSVAVVGHD